jgi:hypothetical protein
MQLPPLAPDTMCDDLLQDLPPEWALTPSIVISSLSPEALSPASTAATAAWSCASAFWRQWR